MCVFERLDSRKRTGGQSYPKPSKHLVLVLAPHGGGIVILGMVEGAAAEIVPWLSERKVFGETRLMEKSHIQLELGNMYAKLQSLRLLLRHVADLLDRNIPAPTETATLKLLASELAITSSRSMLQMYGWRGIDNDYPIQKRFRDAQQTTIFEGSSEILKLKLCGEFVGKLRGAVR